MSRIISRAEAWERVYESFQNVNFSAFDYNTIKESLLEYLKLYFPEDFNDYIESNELIAQLELFAYIGELIAYRLDLNAHENFLTTAQRKESVLRLAKLISYDPSRNLPARGLVKMTSVLTTETIFDSNGVNLANTRVYWNDANNSNWKEQFLLVMNRILQQEFGSVSPTERVQVNDVLFELYTINNNPITNGTFRYSATVSGDSVSMELVPSALNEFGPYERRPERNRAFSLLYGTDGLGDASDTTGFFMFTKQGTLQVETASFDGVTPNQTFDIATNNINEIDLWINNVEEDLTTGIREIVDDGTVTTGRSGEWHEVDLANAQNIIFNTNPNRKKYEVETLTNDQVRLIFGDAEFADIPSGEFDIWYRTSNNTDQVIPKSSVVNQTSSFTYQGIDGNTETLTFTFSLIGSLQNASPSEDTEHVRRTAPAVYYTQDRMVNNRDYNTFMLQDPTILKLRALNRTYAGDSKYIDWHDPSETYENVKLFGDDLVLYFKQSESSQEVLNVSSASQIVENYIEPLLSSTDFFTILTSRGIDPLNIRREFYNEATDPYPTEKQDIINGLTTAALSPPQTIELYYQPESTPGAQDDLWLALTPLADPVTEFTTANPTNPQIPLYNSANKEGMVTVEVLTTDSWRITHKAEHLVAESQATRFWNTNEAERVITYDTQISNPDLVVVLKANERDTRQSLLSQNWNFVVLGQEQIDYGPNTGLANIHQLSVLPEDTTDDNIPDNMDLDEILDPVFTVTSTGTIDLPIISLYGDIELKGNVDNTFTHEAWFNGSMIVGPTSNDLVDQIVITGMGNDTIVTIGLTDYAYFNRESVADEWLPRATTETVILNYLADQVSNPNPVDQLWKREHGRYGLNFAWFHRTERFHLVDPSSTNIVDIFVIPRGYYVAVRDWLSGKTTVEPDAPTPLSLRTDYSYLLDNKMISDTVILHPGRFKYLFGQHAVSELQASFKVVRPSTGTLTNNQVKVKIVDVIENFFDINLWEFGETFYFTELATAIHNDLGAEIDSVVLVPTSAQNQFGDMFQVHTREDEILQPSVSVNDIEIVDSLNADIIRQEPTT